MCMAFKWYICSNLLNILEFQPLDVHMLNFQLVELVEN